MKGRILELQQKVAAKIEEATAVNCTWVVQRLVENVNRSMQAVPVRDTEGNLMGQYRQSREKKWLVPLKSEI